MNPPVKELPPPEAEDLENEHERRAEEAAAEAADRIKRGQHWLDWLTIGDGLVIGRLKAMRRAGTNRPEGSTYNRAFGDWLDAHKWARDLNKATRNHAMWSADNRAAVDSWRATLASNVREAMNHPSVVKRRFEAEHKIKVDAKPRQSAKEKYEAEIVRLEEENTKMRRQLERDGSLFDLRQDPVAGIARVIAETVTPYRLGELKKALESEIARVKTLRKQAG